MRTLNQDQMRAIRQVVSKNTCIVGYCAVREILSARKSRLCHRESVFHEGVKCAGFSRSRSHLADEDLVRCEENRVNADFK